MPTTRRPALLTAAAAWSLKPKSRSRRRIMVGVVNYPAATQHSVLHPILKIGQSCPRCARGTLYELAEPACPHPAHPGSAAVGCTLQECVVADYQSILGSYPRTCGDIDCVRRGAGKLLLKN
jgi:hypothetical protein